MTGGRRGPDLLDHAVGAACAVGVLSGSSEIASTVSWPVTRLLQGGNSGTHVYFVGGVSGPSWTVAVLIVIMGLLVAFCAHLLSRGHFRAWAPPLAVLSIAVGATVLAFRRGGAEPNEAAVLGVTVGFLLTLAWTAYWLEASRGVGLGLPARVSLVWVRSPFQPCEALAS